MPQRGQGHLRARPPRGAHPSGDACACAGCFQAWPPRSLALPFWEPSELSFGAVPCGGAVAWSAPLPFVSSVTLDFGPTFWKPCRLTLLVIENIYVCYYFLFRSVLFLPEFKKPKSVVFVSGSPLHGGRLLTFLPLESLLPRWLPFSLEAFPGRWAVCSVCTIGPGWVGGPPGCLTGWWSVQHPPDGGAGSPGHPPDPGQGCGAESYPDRPPADGAPCRRPSALPYAETDRAGLEPAGCSGQGPSPASST